MNPSDPAPGLRLRAGRYRLIGPLRRGGSGMVWRALDVRDRVERALKAIPAAMDGERLAEHEGEVAARVQHPGVVRVYDTFAEAGHGWVVMERAAGSLADAVEAHGPLDPALTRRVARELCDALAAAHAAGVVHRDLKPQNVLIRADGGVCLADFGIARLSTTGLTRTGAVLGTIPYMAPEQRRDARAVRPATDVYAFAVLLAWTRTGRTPGELYVPSVLEGLRADLRAAGEPDDALYALIAEAGAYEADARPVDGAALRARLEALPGAVAGDAAELAARLDPTGDAAALAARLDPTGDAVAGDAAQGEAAQGEAAEGDAAEGATRGGGGARGPSGGRGARVARAGLVAVALLALGVAGGWRVAQRGAGPPVASPAGSPAASPAGSPGATPAASPAVSPDPSCAEVWAPTVSSRALGPRETIGVSAADLDGDGHTDVVYANQLDANVSIYWGDGTARLGTPDTLPVGRVSASVALGDADGDGRADLLVPDADRSELRLFRQIGPRRFAQARSIEHADLASGTGPWLVRWDADAVPDLLVLAEGGVKVRRGVGGGDFDTAQINLAGMDATAVAYPRAGATDAVAVWTPTGGELFEAGPGGVPRRIGRWASGGPGVLMAWAASSGTRLFVQHAGALTELLPDGGRCVRGPARYDNVSALADLDADGVPEGLASVTCSGCTSNHIVVTGG